MNDGILAGIDYGAPIKGKRVRYKIGQGASQQMREALVIDTTDIMTGQTTSRASGGTSSNGQDTIDFVLKVPLVQSPVKTASGSNNYGSFMLAVPDGTPAGGDARGANSIDLQARRSAATQVASGVGSTLVGNLNRASGLTSTAMGYSNNATGQDSTAIGSTNNPQGTGGTAVGFANTCQGTNSTGVGSNNSAGGASSTAVGYFNTIGVGATEAVVLGLSSVCNGPLSISVGSRTTDNGLSGKISFSNGRFSANGDSIAGTWQLKRRTTDATPTVMTTTNAAVSSVNQMVLSNNSAISFTGTIVATRKGTESTTETKSWSISGLIRRGANAASTTLVGSTVTALFNDAAAAAWTIGLTADTTNGALAVTATGEAAKSIQWLSNITTNEFIYA